jgi:hypothetical protein
MNDVPPRLVQLLRRHVRSRIVVTAKDRGVKLGIFHIGGDDAACLRLYQKATQQHARALIHIVFEVNETALPVGQAPKTPPDFDVSPYDALLFFKEDGLVHGTPRSQNRSMYQDR